MSFVDNVVRFGSLGVVLTLIQNSLEHKPVEFKLHVYEK
jgi:hypothetical protein